MSLSRGTRLGPYEILAPLGAGAMGEVYRARHVKLGRQAAVKVLPGELAADSERLRRFEREARAASALAHPAIVTIYDIGEQDGTLYIAMELVEGVTLAARLAEGPLAIVEALRLGRSIVEGLARAHAAGIVHRDLKPDNVMVTPDGGAKVLDFGLATQVPVTTATPDDLTTVTRMTRIGTALGTVPYMSPEQAVGGSVAHLSDQFSFGVVLYEMLCGRRPFTGDSVAAVVGAILRDTPPPPRSLRPAVSRDLEALVVRCLDKRLEARFASTEELAAALRRCQEDVGGAPSRRWPSRRAVAAVLVVSALAGAAIAWSSLRDPLVRWLERDTFAEVDRLTEVGDLSGAFRLVRGLEERLPDDSEVRQRLERITIPVSVVTDPPAADVRIRAYASSDAPWIDLGRTPLAGVRIPYALAHWQITRDGFETFEGAPMGERPFTAFARGLVLDPVGSRPEGMVRVPGGPYERLGFPPVELDDYWIDRYEVTNQRFGEFVAAGGYQTEEHWTEAFAEGGRALSWEQARARFVDRTGRPGPADWEFGTFEVGAGELPVGGVSWHEALAYCRSVGKDLPTLYHWSAATVQDQLSDILRVSNFGPDGPAPVGHHAGLSDFGTWDMAGNVKEWCWNETDGRRYILGGSWGEPTHTFRVDADSQPPLSREPTHGFRCARYSDPLGEELLAPVTASRFRGELEPVTEEVFAAFLRMYGYDRAPLEAKVERVDTGSPHWRKETVSFNAAYGGERVLAHLFLPRDTAPPWHVVVWFPGRDAFFLPPGGALASPYLFDFVPRAGRALVYPVYKGMYERHVPLAFTPHEWRDMIVTWSKDLGRTVDYLEERDDLDSDRLAFYGFSSGGVHGPVFTTVDDRFRASVLLAGGLIPGFPPEVNAVHFAPRSRIPTLMINGEDDFIAPFEPAQRPLFELLGAAPADKRHARLAGGHIPSDRLAMIGEVQAWLDRHLGPVAAASRGPGE